MPYRVGLVFCFASVVWLLQTAVHANVQTGNDVRFVYSDVTLQRAARDGVRHIVITDHLSAVGAQAVIESDNLSLSSGFIRLQDTSKSIVGNCTEPPDVEEFGLREDVPEGGCVVEVVEDFLEYGGENTELWLHNLYVVVRANPGRENSSTMVLQKDGALWVTNSVFQSNDDIGRGIDVNSNDGGAPQLFVSDTVFADFKRTSAAGVRLLNNTVANLVRTAFRRNIVPFTDLPEWAGIFGSAAAVYSGALLWLQDVTVVDNVVSEREAGARAFTFWGTEPTAAIFSQERRAVWDWTNEEEVAAFAASQRPNRFLTAGTVLDGLQQEQSALVEQSLSSGDGELPVGPPDTPASGGRSGSDQAAIGASIAAALVFVLLLIALAYIMHTRRQRSTAKAVSEVPESLQPSVQPSLHALSQQQTSSSGARYTDTLPPNTGHTTHATSDSDTHVPMPVGPLVGNAESPHTSLMSHRTSGGTHHLHINDYADTPSAALGAEGGPRQPRNILSNISYLTRTYAGTDAALTLDVTSVSSLPHPELPGQFLDLDLLEKALDNLCLTDTLFMGEFKVLGAMERRQGGQGVVQFAVHVKRGDAVAIKFFLNRNAFKCEEELYTVKDLKKMMPAISLLENNDSGVAVTEEGWRYPPFIVVERGESLDEWQARIQPDFPTIVQVLSHLLERVHTLHGLGVIHRDLKPGNVLWRPGQHSWTLIDYGCAALSGATVRLTFSPAYSPPETLCEANKGTTHVVAQPAMDMWAVGVIAYELSLNHTAFTPMLWPRAAVLDAAMGLRPYPWENRVGVFSSLPELRALGRVVRACLSRNATNRPSAEVFLRELNHLYDERSAQL